jgi:hypothetical protein
MPARLRGAIERAAACLIVAASLFHLAPYARAMATTSLWNDEIVTIEAYSGLGPWHVLTVYGSNSHVLFNLLNSVAPGRRSMAPLRARFLSFVAVLALLVAGLLAFSRRGKVLEGALFFGLFAAHGDFLDLALQARGYGLLALLAGTACWGAVDWMETGSRRGLALVAGSVVLGAWTIPSFVVFGAALLALLFLRRPRRDLLLWGSAAVALSAVLYVPVWKVFLEEVRLYPLRWGRYYQSFDQVGETLRVYVLPQSLLGVFAPPWAAFAFLTLLVAAPGLLRENRSRDRDASWLLVGASFLYLTTCLVLTTPPLRTTAFLAVPLVAAALLVLPGAPEAGAPARAALAVACALVFVPASLRAARQFRFVPIEDWQTVSRLLDSVFPRSIGVHVMNAPHLLKPYVGDLRPLVRDPSPDPVARGERTWLDDQIVGPDRFDGRALGPDALWLRVPQRRLGYQAIWFAPPNRSHVVDVRRGRSGGAGTAFEVSLEPGVRYRSIAGRFGGEPVRPQGGHLVLESGWERLDPAGCLFAEGGIVVPLGDRTVRSVELRLGRPAGEEAPLPRFWAYPSD